MIIDISQNVGIGTTGPAAKLHVGGTAGIDGIMFPDGTLQKTAASGGGSVTAIAAGTGLAGGVITSSGTLSLAASGVTAGSFARANVVVDAYGRLAAASASAAIVDSDIALGAAIQESKIAGLTMDLVGKEPSIAAGTVAQYWRGNKSWQTLQTSVVPENTNLYYTDARARLASSVSTSPLSYNNTSGVFNIAQVTNVSNGYLTSTDWLSFNSTASLWMKSGSDIYRTSGYVGLGISTPSAQLHLYAMGGTNRMQVQNASSSGTAEVMLTSDTGQLKLGTMGSGLGGATPAPSYLGTMGSTDLYLMSNGFERLRLTSLGNVGIGTTAPAATLNVAADATGAFPSDAAQLILSGATNGNKRLGIMMDTTYNTGVLQAGFHGIGSLPLVINPAGGNVGIGTTNPQSRFHVVGADASNVFSVSNGGAVGGGFFISSAASDPLQLGSLSSSNLGVFTGNGTPQASFNLNGGMTIGTYANGGSFQFGPPNGLAVSGNIGIGTTNPITPLEILSSDSLPVMSATKYGGFYAQLNLRRAGGTPGAPTPISYGTGGLGYLSFMGWDGSGWGQGASIITPAAENWSSIAHGTSIAFVTTANGGITNAERLRINHDGNIGIGSNNPQAALDLQSVSSSGGNVLLSLLQNNLPPGTSNYVKLGQSMTFSNEADMSFFYAGSGSASNALNFGFWGTPSRMTLMANGNVGIGILAPTEKLHVVGNLRVQGSTDCTLGTGSGATNCTSDIRLKENVTPIAGILEKISLLRGVEFDWNEKSLSPGKHSIGVIAQDIEKVFPSAVITSPDTGYKMVDYAVLVAPLIEAVKALHQENAKVKANAAAMEAENQEIKAFLCEKFPDSGICAH